MTGDRPLPGFDAARAEAETRAGDRPVPVDLGGHPIEVQPVWQWPPRGLAAAVAGDWHVWAHLCLQPASRPVWATHDPTMEQAAGFVAGWETRSGQQMAEIRRMRALLAAHARELEADLAPVTDLRDLWRPGGGRSMLTWRRLAVLVDGLSGESATKTAIRDATPPADLAAIARDGTKGRWSHTDLLLATVIDRLGWIHTALYRAAGGTKAKYPEPWPRPGVGGPARRVLTEQQRAYLRRTAAEHAKMHGY